MSFDVAAESYDRFMGRYSRLLSAQMADLAGVRAGQRAIDVGCGPGALTAELVERLGADHVAAVDPSEPFVDAARTRYPGVNVRQAPAERIPFDDREFDAALAQLVVHFMARSDRRAGRDGARDPARRGRRGLRLGSRRERGSAGGVLGGGSRARPRRRTMSRISRALARVTRRALPVAGLRDVEEASSRRASSTRASTSGGSRSRGASGPAGAHVASLDPAAQAELRERSRSALPPAPFTVTARAWAARGLA